MMKNRKKGFTIVELLVVITLIGVLSLVAGVSMNKILKKNRENGYKETYEKIFEAIHMCNKMSTCDLDPSTCTNSLTCPDIGTLVNAGLLDESITKTVDPACKSNVEFKSGDPISIGKIATKETATVKGISESDINLVDWNQEDC